MTSEGLGLAALIIFAASVLFGFIGFATYLMFLAWSELLWPVKVMTLGFALALAVGAAAVVQLIREEFL